jgi:hypothetical protein
MNKWLLLLLAGCLWIQSDTEAQQRQLYFLSHYPQNPVFNLQLEGNYSLMNGGPGVSAIDVSDFYNPFIAGFTGLSSFATGMCTGPGYLYVSGGMIGGFHVINTATLPNINQVGTISMTGSTYQMVKKQNLVYFTTNQDSLFVVDVSNAMQPVVAFRTSINSFTSGVAYSGNTLYLGSLNGLMIYDITMASNPVMTGSIMGAVGGLEVDSINNILYAYHNAGVTAYDITVPLAPVFIRNYFSSHTGAVINPISVFGNLLYRVSGGTVEVFETSGPSVSAASSYNIGSQVMSVDSRDSLVYVSGVTGMTILKFGYVNPLGINQSIPESGFKFSPNPFSDEIKFVNEFSDQKLEIIIRSVEGKKIMSCHVIDRTSVVSVPESIRPGFYLIEVTDSSTGVFIGSYKAIKL